MVKTARMKNKAKDVENMYVNAVNAGAVKLLDKRFAL